MIRYSAQGSIHELCRQILQNKLYSQTGHEERNGTKNIQLNIKENNRYRYSQEPD